MNVDMTQLVNRVMRAINETYAIQTRPERVQKEILSRLYVSCKAFVNYYEETCKKNS